MAVVPKSLSERIIFTLTGLLINFRWIVVVPIVLPLSFCFEYFWKVRDWYIRVYKSAPELHAQRVAGIKQRVANWKANGKPGGHLCTARPNWMSIAIRVPQYKSKQNAIPIELYDILGIDVDRRVVITEPLVNIGQLTHYLTPKGWTLPVVPELDDLTVGGLISGYGIEGSSHKYGLFCDLVESMEVLVGNGEVLRCSRTENADLFNAIPWSYGSMGFILSVELRIMPAKPWVRLTYVPTFSMKECCDVFAEEICKKSPHEFVEAIMYSKNTGVVMLGDLVERPEADGKVNEVGWWFKPWFYKHIESMLKHHAPVTEYIPVRQYYHRHTRSIFWEGELIIPFGNHWIFRYLLGWLMPPKIGFLKLTQGEYIRKYYEDMHVCQDGLVPVDYLHKTVDFFHEVFECYPLWLCPHKTFKTEPQGLIKPTDDASKLLTDSNGEKYEMYVDVGAWYAPGFVLRGEPFNSKEAVRRFEKFMIEHRGYQCLYAVTEMPREDYRKMFNVANFDKARKKYGSEGVFMDTYEKVRRR